MTTNIDALAGANPEPSPDPNTAGANTTGTVQPEQKFVEQPQAQPALPENSKPPEQPADTAEEKKPDEVTHEQMATDAKKVLETVKLDSAAIEKEWFGNDGKLNEETYKAFEEIGISKDIVDNYGRMMQEKQSANFEQEKAAYITAVDAVSGGREKTVELISYLNSGAVAANEVQILKQQLDSGNKDVAILAIKRIQNLHAERYGTQGKPIQGMHGPVTSSGDIFSSLADAQLAFNKTLQGDPRETKMRQEQWNEKLMKTNKIRKARGEQPFYTA